MNNSVIKVLDGTDRSVGLLCRIIVLATGAALLVSIGIGVSARYVISVGGADWAEEVPKLIFPWFIMAGVVLAVQGGNHIAVDLIMQVISDKVKRLLIPMTNLLVFIAYIYLAKTAFEVAEITAAEVNPILGTPGSLPFYALTAGSVLTAIGSLSIAIRVAILGAEAAPQAKPEDSVQ